MKWVGPLYELGAGTLKFFYERRTSGIYGILRTFLYVLTTREKERKRKKKHKTSTLCFSKRFGEIWLHHNTRWHTHSHDNARLSGEEEHCFIDNTFFIIPKVQWVSSVEKLRLPRQIELGSCKYLSSTNPLAKLVVLIGWSMTMIAVDLTLGHWWLLLITKKKG